MLFRDLKNVFKKICTSLFEIIQVVKKDFQSKLQTKKKSEIEQNNFFHKLIFFKISQSFEIKKTYN